MRVLENPEVFQDYFQDYFLFSIKFVVVVVVVVESSGNLLNSSKKYEMYGTQ